MRYYKYSDYLKNTYGEKVYKIPVNLPGTCPNRDGTCGTKGCIYCSDIGTGFESQENRMSVEEQLLKNIAYIGPKYGAHQYIAYFQNYSNTYRPIDQFEKYMRAACLPSVVGLSISTRPDVVGDEYLDLLKKIETEYKVTIEIELGLQSVKDKTLEILNRGHDYADFEEAVNRIHAYGFSVCVHLIGSLPWDSDDDFYQGAHMINQLNIESVKIHSLYILKGTLLGEWYEAGQIELISADQYLERVCHFIRLLSPKVSIQRLFGRAPKEETLFCNWQTSWRKLQNTLEHMMDDNQYQQGDLYEECENESD